MLKKIAKNTSYLAFSAVIDKLIYFFWTAWIARLIGVDLFGTFSFVTAFVILFTALPDLGAGLVLVRQISRSSRASQKNLFHYHAINRFLSLASLLIIPFVFSLTIRDEANQALVVVAALSFTFSSLRNPLVVLLQGKEQMKHLAVFSIINIIAPTLLSAIFIALSTNLFSLYLGQAIGMGLSFLALRSFVAKKFPQPRYKFSFTQARALLSKSLPIGLAAFSGMIMAKVDNLLIVQFLNTTSLGIFAVANSVITGVLGIFSNTLSISTLPALSQSSDRQSIFKVLKFIVMVSLLLTLAIIVLAPLIIPLIFGNNYAPAVALAQLLSASLLFVFINRLLEQILIVKHLEKRYLAVNLTGALITITANIYLIPRMGIKGAAYSRILSQAIVSAILGVIIWQYARNQSHSKAPALKK